MLPPPWLKIMQRYFFPAKYYNYFTGHLPQRLPHDRQHPLHVAHHSEVGEMDAINSGLAVIADQAVGGDVVQPLFASFFSFLYRASCAAFLDVTSSNIF